MSAFESTHIGYFHLWYLEDVDPTFKNTGITKGCCCTHAVRLCYFYVELCYYWDTNLENHSIHDVTLFKPMFKCCCHLLFQYVLVLEFQSSESYFHCTVQWQVVQRSLCLAMTWTLSMVLQRCFLRIYCAKPHHSKCNITHAHGW